MPALAIVLAGAAVSFLPVQEWVDTVEGWISAKGITGDLLFVLIYILATLLLLPLWIFTVAAGALFGVGWGFLLVWVAALTGATIAFVLARYFFRDSVKKLVARKPWLDTLDKALRKEGWTVVALLRLSPLVPFGVKSYLFGVTKLKLRDYVLGTAIGKVPGEVVYLFLGATGRAAMGEAGATQWVLLGAGIIATVIAIHLIARAARKRLGIDPALR